MLRLRAENAARAAAADPANQQKQQAAQQAQAEQQQFNQQRQTQPEIKPLPPEEKEELKKLYRKAAQKCHPDKLPEEQKEAGKKMFQALEEAHRNQNLDKVREIWHNLQQGNWTLASDFLANNNDVAALEKRVVQIRTNIAALQQAINHLHTDEHWLLIMQLKQEEREWDDYLHELKDGIEADIQTLRQNDG